MVSLKKNTQAFKYVRFVLFNHENVYSLSCGYDMTMETNFIAAGKQNVKGNLTVRFGVLQIIKSDFNM